MIHKEATWYYTPKVRVEPSNLAYDNFDMRDDNFLDGSSPKRPPDFDLHLALYILQKETLPDNILIPLKEWARDNKKVMVY